MAREIKANLDNIWSKEHLEFVNFQISKKENVDRLLEKFPQKYCEVEQDSSEDEVVVTHDSPKSAGKGTKRKKFTPAKKSPTFLKSPVNRGKEPSEWANILFLNSGDNDMANFTQNALNQKYNLTVTPVSNLSLYLHIILCLISLLLAIQIYYIIVYCVLIYKSVQHYPVRYMSTDSNLCVGTISMS